MLTFFPVFADRADGAVDISSAIGMVLMQLDDVESLANVRSIYPIGGNFMRFDELFSHSKV